MKWKANLWEINFKVGQYIQHLQEEMQQTTKEAARSWLQTVLVPIPTWSSASRATFKKLAEAVDFQVTFGPLQTRDRSRLGERLSDGGVDFREESWHFYYETNLRYLAYNDVNVAVRGKGGVFSGLTNPTPYHFQSRGQEDFKSFSKLVKLPSPLKFIAKRRL